MTREEIREEVAMEQIYMERLTQPSGAEIKLCILEIPAGLVGHPYTVERQVNGQWQHSVYGLTYAAAQKEYRSLRKFETENGSIKTLLGSWSDD